MRFSVYVCVRVYACVIVYVWGCVCVYAVEELGVTCFPGLVDVLNAQVCVYMCMSARVYDVYVCVYVHM